MAKAVTKASGLHLLDYRVYNDKILFGAFLAHIDSLIYAGRLSYEGGPNCHTWAVHKGKPIGYYVNGKPQKFPEVLPEFPA